MKREDIRRKNARALAESVGGIAEFGRKTEMETSQVSQIIGKNPTKNIGNLIAARIEKAFELPEGALDAAAAPLLTVVKNDPPVPSLAPDLSIFGDVERVSVGNPNQNVIPVRLVNLRVQAGYPMFEADPVYDEESTIDLPRQWVEENHLIPNCLLAIKVKGPSMEPMIYEGEKIIINIADQKLVSGQVYAVNFQGSALVKQMVYKNKEWWLYSFNHDDEFRPVMARGGEFNVVGKLVAQPFRSLIGKL